MSEMWGPYCIVGLHISPERRELTEWVRAPLSELNQEFRIQTLGRAFGLGPDYIRDYIDCVACSMGQHLLREIVAWTREHPDLQANQPDYRPHELSAVRPE